MDAEQLPASPVPGRLKPLERFLWSSLVLVGGSIILIRFLTIVARHELLFDDFVADRTKIPLAVQGAVYLQRFMSEYWFLIVTFVLLPVAIWIWVSRRPKAVRVVAISVVSVLFVQGLVSVLITVSHFPVLMRQLQGP